MTISKASLFLKRFLLNVRSNRLWIIWAGSLYIRTQRHELEIEAGAPTEAISWASQTVRYLRWDSWFGQKQLPSRVAAVIALELGMFGNMTRRLANATSLALALRIGGIVVPKASVFHRGLFRTGRFALSDELTMWFAASPTVFSNDVRLLMASDLYRDYGLGGSNSDRFVAEGWQSLQKMLLPKMPHMSSGPNNLTIHLRGGDVFGPRKPKAYGQPPLAFYSLILRSEAWSSVTIVCQDDQNPVLEPLENLCTQLGYAFSRQNESLDKDLSVLLAAENLVAGRGTFVPAVAGLSPHCRRVFYFHDKCNIVPYLEHLRIVRVADLTGIYQASVLSKNWQNSVEQRELMISYPLSSLVMEGP